MKCRMLARPLAVLLATLIALLGPGVAPGQQPADPHHQVHKVKKGDTLELLAAEYYGDRRYAIYIMYANQMQHSVALRPGMRLKIPTQREVTVKTGDTLKSLAEQYLGDAKRDHFLAGFNNLPPGASIAVGQVIHVPFHITYKAGSRVQLKDVAAAYYGSPKKADLIREYNFLGESAILSPGQLVVVPMHHVQVTPSKLPPVDSDSKALRAKRSEQQKLAMELFSRAQDSWRAGTYAEVKRLLTQIESDFLDAELAVEIGILLGSTYVAFDDTDSALAIFKKVLERNPNHKLDPYEISPKILKVWQDAEGTVAKPKQAGR